jgi:hypothetical protein
VLEREKVVQGVRLLKRFAALRVGPPPSTFTEADYIERQLIPIT